MTQGGLVFACRILGWIFHAQRLMTMGELQHALAIKIGVPSFQSHLIPDPSEIIRVCAGLISLDENRNLVIFSHETVKPFLRENKLQDLPSHLDLAKACLTFFQLPVFANPADRYDPTMECFKFGTYAAKFLNTHSLLYFEHSERDAGLEEGIVETFNSKTRRHAAYLFRHDNIYFPWDSLITMLIDLRLSFLVISPLSTDKISCM
jgi:hypothetical protein